MPRHPRGPRLAPLQTFLLLRDPYGYLSACQRRYGDPFVIPTLAGSSVVTGHPEGVRALFSAPPETYRSAAAFLGPLLGDSSLLLLEGARHRAVRRVFMHPLSGGRMRAYSQLMQEVTREHVAGWAPGRALRMSREMEEITNAITVRAIFGVKDPARARALRDAALGKLKAFKSYLVLFEGLRRELGGFGPWARFQAASRRFHALLTEEMRRRRAEGGEGGDILSLLLQARYEDGSALSDEEILDQVGTLWVAGYETTATTLAWAFYWLHRHGEVRERVLAELDALGPEPAPAAVDELPYLTAVCHETLRLNPAVLQVSRVLARDFDLMGCRLRAGAMVSVGVSLVHSREELYSKPYAFEPERFLRRSYAPHEFVPFGGGARRCVGAAFAVHEMKQILAVVLRSRRLRLASDRPERAALLGPVMRPAGGVEMEVVEARR